MSEPSPAGPSLERIIAGFCSFVLSQAPTVSVLAGITSFSLYQPGIYRGYEWFLLVPAGLALGAIYLVETAPWGFWVVFPGFFLLAAVVALIYQTFPPDSAWHPWNWILSYCAVALLLAMMLHIYLFARRLGP